MENSENNEKIELITSSSSFLKQFSKSESSKKAWDYFDKNPDKCYCKYKGCNQTYSIGTATTRLIKHYTESHLKNSEKNGQVPSLMK